jgi:predicted 3-demethylubiquinone-9 3-methyltransferase (glyoxalase superfamily)
VYGDPKAQQCGWLKDKDGLSWQVVSTVLPEMFKDHESQEGAARDGAMRRMKKIDIAELERAVAGSAVTA